jgi:hypothetical protein
MPVPISNVPRRVVYAASGVGPYAFTFEILAQTDIEVYKGDTLLTLTTDYTVTINANGTGSVTLVSTAGTSQIAIVGARAIQRTTDFTTGGDFFANSVNDELDSLTIFAQQNQEGLDRALIAPQTDPLTIDMTLPRAADRAGKLLAFDANGDPIVGEDIGNWRGNWAAGVAYRVRDLVKDASNSNVYRCNTAHTSTGTTPISSNADSAKWDLVIDAAAADASADLAQEWATKTDGQVASTDYSAKAWSIGGTGVTSTSSRGAAKEWATKTSGAVDTSEYSAKEYAVGTQIRGTTGSAKDWAQYTGGTVDGTNYSAKYHASAAATSASNASTSASNAATSASNASTSASNAASAQSAAESARDATLAAFDSFDDRYLGTKTADPTLDNDGNALVAGALYFNSVSGIMKVYTGSAWVAAYVSAEGLLSAANNLSDLTNTATARTNLGLGTGDSPQFTAVNVGNASDTTITRASAGVIAVEGSNVLLASNIGSTVQAYDADTAKTDVAQTFTISQRGTVTTDNDGSFSMSATNNFKCTPTGNFTLTFTNITAGQSGNIWLDNSGGYTVSAHSAVYINTDTLTAISAAGVYWLSYYSPDGTNVAVAATGSLT